MKKILAVSILLATALFALNGCMGESASDTEELQASVVRLNSIDVQNEIANLENFEEIASSEFSLLCNEENDLSTILTNISSEQIYKKTLFSSDKYTVFLYKTSNAENLKTEEFVSRFENCTKDQNIQPYKAEDGYLLWSESNCDNANKPLRNHKGYGDWRNCKITIKQLTNL